MPIPTENSSLGTSDASLITSDPGGGPFSGELRPGPGSRLNVVVLRPPGSHSSVPLASNTTPGFSSCVSVQTKSYWICQLNVTWSWTRILYGDANHASEKTSAVCFGSSW